MPDTSTICETALGATLDATPRTPTEAAPASSVAPIAPAPRPEIGVADTARLLAEHFPALFGAGAIKPIKLRIQVDIHQSAPGVFTKKALSTFLQRYTTGTAYLRALAAEGATRIDLDGQPVGEVAAEHRDAASVELERRRAIVEARKHAGRGTSGASRHDARSWPPPATPRAFQQAEVSQFAGQASADRSSARGSRTVSPGSSDSPDRSSRQLNPSEVPGRFGLPQALQQSPGQPGAARSGAGRRPDTSLPQRRVSRASEQEPANPPAVEQTQEELVEAEARQQRALLLRSFEQSPLSKANFGALKGLSERALDMLLTLARQERGQR